MATNKDRIEKLELEIQDLKEVMQKMNAESQSSFAELKELFFKGFEHGESSADKGNRNQSSGHSNGSKGSSNFTKLEFPRYSGDDLNVRLNRVVQYFNYKQIPEEQKVSLAAVHLESEANQWWQWVQKLYKEVQVPITWDAFERELLIRFGPTEVKDYDEALSRIQQEGTLQDYQQEFEHLANRVVGWPQKALVGTFLGGLQQDIVYAVRMFKPKTLRDAIELACMRDDNLSRDRKIASGEGPTMSTNSAGYSTHTTRPYSSGAAKKLSWEEMQKRREKGLCFGCNEKFTSGYRCQTPQALSIEVSATEERFEEFENGDTKIVGGKRGTEEVEPLINFST
jgi:hypothetical protein